MSLYRLLVKVRNSIDKLRKCFLWYGDNNVEKKISLVAWRIVCRNKSQGGLEILDLKIMSSALLAKWFVRFCDPQVQKRNEKSLS